MDMDLFIDMLGIPSTSGEERRFSVFLKERLAQPVGENLEPPAVIEQEVGDGTLNLLFDWSGTAHPSFVFCTHMDTVPPYISPTVECILKGDILPDGSTSEADDTLVKGRGSCDAKGQIFAMYNACLLLAAEGYRDFGLLLLSGEETGSHGAKAYTRDCPGGAFVLVGEPTGNRLVAAAKGTKSFEVTIPGKACHSGYPEHGVSAVDLFVDLMEALRSADFPEDPVLGKTTWNVGDLLSGNPQNILSPEVRFRIYFRTTFATDGSVQDRLVAACPPGTVVQAFGGDVPQEYFSEVRGIGTATASFGSDAPRLEKFGRKAICGPGSILVAHTGNEYVLVSELQEAVRNYVRIYEKVMNELNKNDKS